MRRGCRGSLGRPVRVQGMRVEGTAWDPKGPACVHRARAALDAAGKVWPMTSRRGACRASNVSYHEADPRDTLDRHGARACR